ncbi:MAG: putative bifunctional diguanylate cyclase/phosphodiesterase, partial [Gemmatimonadota bacterium]
VEGEEIALSACVGLARWPLDAEDADALLRNCEMALHRSKQWGGGRYGFYQESMREDASRRVRVSNLLRRAIEGGRLELHFQPRVRPRTGAIVGFEALSRWTDPELGAVSPEEFIPVAEATGSIAALGAWCLEAAAGQLRAWHEHGYPDLSVSVNLSRQQIERELVEHVVACTEGMERSRVELEVTESALMEDGDEAIEILSRLRELGFRIALDDFGTGYSSLSYLQGLPIDTVKVDRGFIRDIAEDEDAAALTGSVLDMCRALRLHTVVEGIETEAQREVLLALGCEEAQGFLFGRAMPAARTWECLEHAAGRSARRSRKVARRSLRA